MTKPVEPDEWTRLIDDLWRANPASSLLPISPGEISRSLQRLWLDALQHPERAWSAYADFVGKSTQIWTNATLEMWGITPRDKSSDVVKPDSADRRFSAP